MGTLLHDFRFALRVLRQSRTATAMALLALALGTGANTAIFSVVYPVLMRPLPYAQPQRIVTMLGPNSRPVAPAVFFDLGREARSFEQVDAAQAWSANLTGGDHPEQVHGLQLTEGMFELLGVAPLRGNADVTGERNLVISHGLWQRRFEGADVVGKKVLLDGEAYTITAVMPPSFRFAPFWVTDAEMWSRLDLSKRVHDRGGQSLRVFGRLAPEASVESAQAEVAKLCRDFESAYPDTDTKLDIRVEPLHEKVVGKIRTPLLILLASVGLVLLIACANVANVSLARAAARQREMAIRLSLGAARGRIARQLLTESLVLSLAGGALGLLLAMWGTHALATLSEPAPIPRWQEVGISTPVLWFTLAIAVATGLLFGLAPALMAGRQDVNGVLKQTGRGIAEGSRARRLLVVGEVALAFVLLAGAGLLVRSFIRLQAVDPGFDSRRLLTMTISTAGKSQYMGAGRENLYQSIVSRVQAAPGVRQVSLVNHLPLGGDLWGVRVAVEGRPIPRPGEENGAVYRVSLPGYFATMRIPVIAGRDFDDRDRTGRPGVAIVNDALARHEFGNDSPIGKRITLDDPRKNPEWLTVVGVVQDVKQGNWVAPADNEVYVPLLQTPALLTGNGPGSSYITMVVRTAGDPAGAASAVRSAIWSVDRNLPISQLRTMEDVVGRATFEQRLETTLAGLFAGLALALAAVGIYGVIAYEVTQRTREIGIRMALGASRSEIFRMVVGQTLRLAGGGMLAGVVAALWLSRYLRTLLYGVSATDPLTFGTVAAAVGLMAALAAFAPALRASGTDPAVSIRYE